MTQKNILFEESAVRETLQELKRLFNYRFTELHYINKKRYCVVYGEPNIAILLKTEPFFNFGYKFRDKGESGVGDTINTEALKDFNRRKVKWIYTKFRDGKLYRISMIDVVLKSHEWIQKEGTEVRSFSIHLYERIN